MKRKALIVGGGPAGISAALYVLRAGFNATVIYSGSGALEKAEKIENYYGFPGGISGAELLEAGRGQARELGAELICAEATGLSWDGQFALQTTEGVLRGDALILATGTARKRPAIENFSKFDGMGVSWCASCDGFFCRGKQAAVLGAETYAISEAKELLPLAAKVTLLTDGADAPEVLPDGISVDTRKITALEGGELMEAVVFSDGEKMAADRLFVALGTAGGAELALKAGAVMDGGAPLVDGNFQTTIPGLFAAGDCLGAPFQVWSAVAQGSAAGTSAAKFLRDMK